MITIIILLILAGVTIVQLTSSGLLTKAQQAAKESKYANAAEKVALAVNASYDTTGSLNDDYLKDNLNRIDGINEPVEKVEYDLKVVVDGFEFTISKYGKITGEKTEVATLPENTKDTEAGTKVKLKEEWGDRIVKYIKTEDGKEAQVLNEVSTIYAVSVGGGESVPVPNGFVYVGGNLDTGVVISDKDEDEYKGVDRSSYEYRNQLQGNQFVWIPCTKEEYKKYDEWNGIKQTNTQLGDSWWETTEEDAELTQIEKYGGFYVGRYEAGLPDTMEEFTGVITNSYQKYNQDGIPQSKADLLPWNLIDWNHAKKNSRKMYSDNNYVNSGLMTGTQWDTMLNTIVNKTDLEQSDLTNSSEWGNYKNNSISYKGRKAYIYESGGSWHLQQFGEYEENGTTTDYGNTNQGNLLTTGASKTTEKYHICDLAGNLHEWTEETSFSGLQYRIFRGGSSEDSYTAYPACGRISQPATNFNVYLGFRVVLYIK